MVLQFISSYRLRKTDLKNYLQNQFPGYSISISEGRDDSYTVELPQKLSHAQLDEIWGLQI